MCDTELWQVLVYLSLQSVYDKHLEVEFQSEIQTLAKVEHLNLVKFYGYLEHGNERIVVAEYVPNGTLREHLDCEFSLYGFTFIHSVWAWVPEIWSENYCRYSSQYSEPCCTARYCNWCGPCHHLSSYVYRYTHLGWLNSFVLSKLKSCSPLRK